VNKIKLKQKLNDQNKFTYVPNKNVKKKSEKVLFKSATQKLKISTFLDVKFVDILRLANAMLASL